MFSYRPESVYLKRTFTSLSGYAFRRTAPAEGRGYWSRRMSRGAAKEIFRRYAAHRETRPTPAFGRGYALTPLRG
jgi:hypothetical protein